MLSICRHACNDEVEDVIARSTQQGLASGSLADAVMGVMYFRNGLLAQFHDAFTIAHTGTGLEVHGTDGSLVAESVMTQDTIGRITLKRGDLHEEVKLDAAEDLYIRSVHNFNQAVMGKGQPSATGEDGLKSLAIGLAVLESTKTGRQVNVRHS
jgi:1,5-anhydro-D-fructose reductase (1,5-anhydro-D-mannitol-forming)